MNTLEHYQVYLFDFDGLLVNTESFHYRAYCKMFEQRGLELDWDFFRYCQAAHRSATALQEQMYHEFPELHKQEAHWEVLYAEKKTAYLNLLATEPVELMPGAKELLLELAKRNIKRSVVTHSPLEQISKIRKQHPVLNSIPNWVTREDYNEPKPSPDSYLTAIKLLAKPGDAIIGFEDTPRGVEALSQTEAQAVIVCDMAYPLLPEVLKKHTNVYHLPSLESIALSP